MHAKFAALLLFGCGLLVGACGRASAPDPFSADGAGGAGGEGGEGGSDLGSGGQSPVFGRPCVDDEQCDDGIACTADSCDMESGRCRYEADDSVCQNDVYCDGEEVCDLALGCMPGGVVTCSDDDTCTIDTCIESTQSCQHELRDADGDGDPDLNCGGGDCDDTNALVSSLATERCGNGIDDDCDGVVDGTSGKVAPTQPGLPPLPAPKCTSPRYDTCSDPLIVDHTGSYDLSFAAAGAFYSLSCAENEDDTPFRTLVLAVVVPEGEARDVDLEVATLPPAASSDKSVAHLALAPTAQCGKASAEESCVPGVTFEREAAGRLILRQVPPGTYAVYVACDREREVRLRADFRDPEPAPDNETCARAEELLPGVPSVARLASVQTDVVSACDPPAGDLFYHFVLDQPRDVTLTAFSRDELGRPVLSLRSAHCASASDEITCRSASPSELFARALPAGDYFVAVSATAPIDVEVALSLADASVAPADEGCAAPDPLGSGARLVSLSGHTDAVQVGCLPGAADATFALDLEEPSDVLLIGRGAGTAEAALALLEPPCTAARNTVTCTSGPDFPLRLSAPALPAGSYRAVIEASSAADLSLSGLVRPTAGTTLVPNADECDSAVAIPSGGGRFEGNTTNVFPDYEASCDVGGLGTSSAPDQMLELSLKKRRRVVFDLGGSSYDTLLVLRHADACPGSEVDGSCVPGYVDGRSFLDIVLDAGDYWVQIDGYNGQSGKWFLDVFVADP